MTNLLETLEMEVLKVESGYVKMKMPVSDKVKQPFGYLHGGATMALGETACSIGAAHMVDTDKVIPVGLEMNTNHIRSAIDGYVYAIAELIHGGRSTQVWNINLVDDQDKLISVMRGTMMLKPRK
ncbi:MULTISPECIES: PaaI family thioesterase [Staphylococcus]|uniref:Esterase YdiI n=1 Tax=Staphylococcus simulans TaxID=1286 RepID=A0A6N3CAQ4_STASI|nr:MULTISPECIES: PaaI family thioesterase [Staphylococcus]MBO0386958.1 PaaI family thioesterase [Staphylococcus simulans]MBU6943250.1 PaaI family thioesterase [Staphylococcus sp. CWZ226]MDK7927876.1 PaaI family thioesterase [Staphylococcus simulans]MDK8316544.1 PaaI family thioesterase [Staphylococcus simulans]MDN6062090.1 PaaI family thioesterase [Staphylococcus simulans]